MYHIQLCRVFWKVLWQQMDILYKSTRKGLKLHLEAEVFITDKKQHLNGINLIDIRFPVY